MSNNGIEDILIGESYKSTKKKKKWPIIFFFLLLIIAVGFGVWYYYQNSQVVDSKELFSKNLLASNAKQVLENDFYSSILDKCLKENSESNTNITVSTTKKIEKLHDIDINNFDFNLTTQNDLKGKNIFGELSVKYSGNDFLNFKGIINENKFAIISDEIVNKYVGVQAQNFSNIFESDIDLEFIYEILNSEKIDLTDEQIKTYTETYYKKISDQIPIEKFSQKDNILITSGDDYKDATAYEMTLSQEELKNILKNVLTDLKNEQNLLNAIAEAEPVELDLSDNDSQNTENNTELNQPNNNQTLEPQNDDEENLEVRNDENSFELDLTPVSEVNFQTAEEINTEENVEDQINNEELPEEETLEEEPQEEEILEETQEDFNQERTEENTGLILEANNDEKNVEENFDALDLIKILLGRKVNIPLDKIIEKIDEYIENFDGNGITITLYVTDEGTEKITVKLPDENTVEIQFIENTEKENNIQIIYLYKDSDYKDGISINIDSIHDSASNSLKIVKNYIEGEKVNKRINFSLKTDGTKSSNSLSNDIVITVSTDSDETKIIAENEIKFLSDNLVLEKLTPENSVFIDDLTEEDRELVLQSIKDKIDIVLEDKRANMEFIDLNTGSSIVGENLNNTTTNNYELIKNMLQNSINNLKDEVISRQEEFTFENLNDISIDGHEITVNIYDDKAIIAVDDYTYSVDMEFNVLDT